MEKNKMTVAQELTHARSYMNIQKVRFGDLFVVEEEIDEEILGDVVLKMLLQPLIENAILHGFQHSDTSRKNLVLTVRVQNLGDAVQFQICNQAAREDFLRIQDILNQVPDVPCNNYGISSIRNRLEIAYNHEAQFTYDLDEESVLTATIRIPRCYTNI